jgi:parallel beta-helix repeat protein
VSGVLRRGVVLTATFLLGPTLVTAGLVLTTNSASAATPVTLVASADSYVDAGAQAANFGTATALRVDGDPEKVAYLKFNIPSGTALTGSVVKLRFFAETSHTAGVTSYGVANAWTETEITYENAPKPDATAGNSSGRLVTSSWAEIDVTKFVQSTGTVSLALKTASSSAVRISSRESSNKPQLVIAGTTTTEFTVSPVAGGPYRAASSTTLYTGTLKSVVERAVADLKAAGGGTVRFDSGNFDFAESEYFSLKNVTNIDFVGAGIDKTVIRNHSDAAADTEPFNFTGANGVKIREMTVAAAGTARGTSDVIDFDRGNNSLVENVKITESRARGIVFDGKDAGATAEGNTIRNCSITGVPGAAIEFLASSRNTVTGCDIKKVGNAGIYVHQSGSSADQPNKKSTDNIISANTIDNAGRDGVYISNGDRNKVLNNTITNSSDVYKSRDGIKINSVVSGLSCDDNTVAGNTATDNQTTKTQTYGLNIGSPLCNRTVVGPGNNFAGNRLGEIHDAGTGTVYKTS